MNRTQCASCRGRQLTFAAELGVATCQSCGSTQSAIERPDEEAWPPEALTSLRDGLLAAPRRVRDTLDQCYQRGVRLLELATSMTKDPDEISNAFVTAIAIHACEGQTAEEADSRLNAILEAISILRGV
jgi:hypothetical protein